MTTTTSTDAPAISVRGLWKVFGPQADKIVGVKATRSGVLNTALKIAENESLIGLKCKILYRSSNCHIRLDLAAPQRRFQG